MRNFLRVCRALLGVALALVFDNRASASEPPFDIHDHPDLLEIARPCMSGEYARCSELKDVKELTPIGKELMLMIGCGGGDARSCLVLGDAHRAIGSKHYAKVFYRRAIAFDPQIEEPWLSLQQWTLTLGNEPPDSNAGINHRGCVVGVEFCCKMFGYQAQSGLVPEGTDYALALLELQCSKHVETACAAIPEVRERLAQERRGELPDARAALR